MAEYDATLQDYGPPASMMESPVQEQTGDTKKSGNPLKRALNLGLKISVSLGALYLVYGRALGRDGMAELTGQLANIRWPWFVAAMSMQLTAIGFAIVRWRMLLGGQGIGAKWSFLAPSFMIGRFWGAFTPGGLGLDGWRLYDVAKHSGKPARAVAVTVAEKILGQLAFGLVVMGGSLWGLSLMGVEGVIMVNAFFVVIVSVGLTFIAKPQLFQPLFRLLPLQVQPRIQTLVDAVSAYHGKFRMLATAVGFGVGVHAFNNMIYVCAGQAMNLDVTPMVLFFASSIVIMSTMVPLSLNGVGLREATAAGVLGAFGVSPAIAAATYTIGWIAEMCVSSVGIPIFLSRRESFDPKLKVEDESREEALIEELEAVPEAEWPSLLRGLSLAASAGLFGGMLIGLVEGAVVVASGAGTGGFGVMAYGAVAYGIFCAIAAGVVGLGFAWAGRLMKRAAVPGPEAYSKMLGIGVAVFAFALSVFRIKRDVYHEQLALKSPEGLMVLGGCALGAAAIFFGLSTLMRLWTSRSMGSFMLKPWGTPLVVTLIVALVGGSSMLAGPAASATGNAAAVAAPADAPNVLFIVVDTMRADHLPAYGYSEGSTPNLDRFAEDSVRYDQAFSNASWTRPSFASILSGRYASSHGVMAKPDSLPSEITTLPEALSAGGYETAGLVTNFNVGPYFNFGQGFDSYRFLEPEFVLGADDNAAKLLLMQTLRQVIEKVRAARGQVLAGTAYQDAETVNREIISWLDTREANADSSERPFFFFTGYMDPHDPYFIHPYDGSGYSRAAHQHPDADEAAALTELYDGEITYWDQHFGELMDDLRRRGLYDDMMIVVTSDHGEEFGEHGGFWHGTTLYDEQVHVPLFVKLPANQRAGTHVNHWVQSVDLMPSVLTRIGLDVPEGVQGGSLEEGTTRVFAEESHEGNVLESVRELRNLEELKLITANPGNPRGLETVELYRPADDVGETRNLAEAENDQVRALMVALEEARTAAAEGAVEAGEVEMDEDTRRQLCQLGYLDSEQCCAEGLLSGAQCN